MLQIQRCRYAWTRRQNGVLIAAATQLHCLYAHKEETLGVLHQKLRRTLRTVNARETDSYIMQIDTRCTQCTKLFEFHENGTFFSRHLFTWYVNLFVSRIPHSSIKSSYVMINENILFYFIFIYFFINIDYFGTFIFSLVIMTVNKKIAKIDFFSKLHKFSFTFLCT